MARTLCLRSLSIAVFLTACASDDHDTRDDITEPVADDDAGPPAVSDAGEPSPQPAHDAGAPPAAPDPYRYANGCFSVRDQDRRWLVAAPDGASFRFVRSPEAGASAFTFQASDLGTYLLYDREHQYLASEAGPLLRQATLLSDISTLDDSYVSGAEWTLEAVPETSELAPRFRFHHRRTGRYLAADGLSRAPELASELTMEPAEACAAHPELGLDAEGSVLPRSFPDGSVYGIVDAHSHVLSNFGFGGGGVFHGAPFHRLGVEHALGDCEMFHGNMGKKDFFGYGFSGGTDVLDIGTLLPALITGELGADNHHTAGYPDFVDWPNGPVSSTHQTQYWRWLERAYLGGLRLMVLHATTNEVICNFMVGQGYQRVRYACDDMVAVDRILEESYAMQRYIDAQAGGPGRGFFRLVRSPAEARAVIQAGKLAVILGIETSNLFGCLSVPRPGSPSCDADYVRAQLDSYYERGVRVMFPVHKYDNAFSAGDGHRGFIELGNFLNSGHWSNFVQDCPGVSAAFDHGGVTFKGLNQPRSEYISAPPNDMTGFPGAPILTLTPHVLRLAGGSLDGEWCQNAGLTELGETLLHEMMRKGMVIEVDHLPQRSYQRAFELLEEADYPAAATHGTNFGGRLYALGGVSKLSLGRCRDPERRGAMLDELNGRLALIREQGGYEAEGFGFDLNGFAGAPRPRFGERSSCSTPQEDPVTYPFTSYAGDVTFQAPKVGNRALDFNTEGLVHIGLLPELLDDARRDAASDADLEPLFRSAEAYLRMWERAEARAAALPP